MEKLCLYVGKVIVTWIVVDLAVSAVKTTSRLVKRTYDNYVASKTAKNA